MPYYDYFCQHCEKQWEDFQTIANREIPTTQPCPQCGKENCVVQMMSVPAIGDPIQLGKRKTTTPFRERMAQIAKTHRTGNINVR